MELKFSGLSPYVRKAMIVAHEVGVAERLTITKVNTREEPEKIAPVNPLGKIPVLITDDGRTIYDSPVICEFLDAEFGGHRLLPASCPRRWEVMTMAALADGLLDASVLIRHERVRPVEQQSADWIAWQLRKVMTGLDRLEEEASGFGSELHMGLIALGCGLGYIPLRMKEAEDLAKWPQLKGWYAMVSQRPSFQRTTPVL